MLFSVLSSHEGEECHEACAFDGFRELSLVRGTDSRVFGVDDFCLTRDKSFQKIDFFIIDCFQILGAEKALLRHGRKCK